MSKELYTIDKIKSGRWRMVRNRKRRRKLLNRGEGITWNHHVNCWVWDYEYKVNR